MEKAAQPSVNLTWLRQDGTQRKKGKYWLCFAEVEKQQRQAGYAPVRLPDSGCISLVSILFSGAEACPRVLIIVDFELPLVGSFSVLV